MKTIRLLLSIAASGWLLCGVAAAQDEPTLMPSETFEYETLVQPEDVLAKDKPAAKADKKDGAPKAKKTDEPAKSSKVVPAPSVDESDDSACGEKNGCAKNDGGCDAAEEEEKGCLQQALECTCLGNWFECHRIKVSGHVQQGYTANADDPEDRLNFGHLFTDRANDYRFNQAILTFERALDPKDCCTDWGFKLQMMYGSDARYIHSLGFMDNITNDTVQPDIVEAFFSYHLPILTEGGVDIKVGQFVTLMGADVIYAPANQVYSHSYIFNFGIPFKHTGVLATTHVTKQFDLHTGYVAGINTGSFDDNNNDWSFHGGFMWKSENEDITVNGSLHVGPENPDNDRDNRYITSMQVSLKLTECLTSLTDLNWGKDEVGEGAEWYGVAQHFIYKVNDCWSVVVRGEVFRDDDGFAVFKDPSNDGFIAAQRGLPNPLVFGGPDTYTALTLGVNWRGYENVLVRPEVRWDWASDGTPYNDGTDDSQFTAGCDVIWSF